MRFLREGIEVFLATPGSMSDEGKPNPRLNCRLVRGHLSEDEGRRFRMGLKATREALGISMWRMAQRLGVDHATIRRWEAGERTPFRWMAEKILGRLENLDD